MGKASTSSYCDKTDNSLPKLKRVNSFPLKKHESYCLVGSSCFFLIPALVAFCYSIVHLGILSVVVSVVSVNYWRYSVPGWRKNCDLLTAKISFAIYFCTGCLTVKDLIYHYIGWPICILIIVCYILSNRRWDKNCHTWKYFHMLFHFFVACEQVLVIVGGAAQDVNMI